MSRQQLREEARQQAKRKARRKVIPTVRTHPRDVIKAMRAEQKKEIRLYALINRAWGYDDRDLVWIEEGVTV